MDDKIGGESVMCSISQAIAVVHTSYRMNYSQKIEMALKS